MEFTNKMIGVVSENEIHPPNGKFDRENMIDSGIVGFPIWKQLYKKWIKLWLYIWRYMKIHGFAQEYGIKISWGIVLIKQ